jgi:hypothetical protein
VRIDAAGVLVPEAPSNVDDSPQTGKNDIGLARQISNMKPKAVAHAVD